MIQIMSFSANVSISIYTTNRRVTEMTISYTVNYSLITPFSYDFIYSLYMPVCEIISTINREIYLFKSI
jgi:hypothetical protein